MSGCPISKTEATAPYSKAKCLRGFLSRHPLLTIALLTPMVLLVHGYHPWADDGAVYVAGIKKLVNQDLYLPDAIFVSSHTRFSIFAHLLATLVQTSRLPLAFVLLACHLGSIFLFLLACWSVAGKIFHTPASRWGAVVLAACFFTLPVAGTSLSIMDPYVTARSLSTPLNLFALAAALGGAWPRAAFFLAMAASLHPLMAAYGAVLLSVLAFVRRGMWRWLIVFCGLGLLLSALIYAATRHISPSLPYSRAALSRSYFFLATWNWYEIPGLVAPLLILGIFGWRSRGRCAAGQLAIAATVMGGCALLCALCFVHPSGSFMLARLQVLRSFHLLYIIGVLLAGAAVGKLARRHLWSAGFFCLAVALAIFAGQRLTYPASQHVEWPGQRPRNQWQQAFLWIRAHCPRDAVFAMDADYIESPGEDSQGFRAMAERSAVPDWLKDGGVASIFPAAAALWWRQVTATEGLDNATDRERLARLTPLGVTWVILPSRATTRFNCPYTNSTVRVCRLGAEALP